MGQAEKTASPSRACGEAPKPSKQQEPARAVRVIPAMVGKIMAEYAQQYDDAHLIGGDVTRMKKIYATASQVLDNFSEEQFWKNYDEAKLAAGKFAHKRLNSQGRVTRVPYFFTVFENLFDFTLEELVYLRSSNPLYDDNTLIDYVEHVMQTYNQQVREQVTSLDYREWLQAMLDHAEHCAEPKQRKNITYRDTYPSVAG